MDELGSSGMSFIDYLCLLLTPALLAAGQLLFKRSADSAACADSAPHFLSSLLVTPYFWAALAIYGATTVLWVFVLSRVPLSSAMPFVALSFVIIPIIGVVVLGEKLNFLYWFGVALIVAGVYTTVIALRST